MHSKNTDGTSDATYAEINDVRPETFRIDVNKCYSNVNHSSSIKNDGRQGSRSSKKQKGFIVTISVLALVVMVLVAACACVIIALVQIATLQQNVNTNSELWLNVSQQLKTQLDQNFSELNSEVQQLRAELNHKSKELERNYSNLHLGVQQLRVQLESSFSSCADLPPSSPSGLYWVRGSNGFAVRVYCDITLSCGNITGGWMRVAELDKTNNYHQCPNGLVEERTDGNIWCELDGIGCFSTTYYTQNINYTMICGRITAYQVGTTNAFQRASHSRSTTIDSNYVDGVSLTHGTSSREHIWTFAAALDRTGNHISSESYCPCQNTTHPKPAITFPSFVGEDYFCDAGNEEFMTGEFGLQTDPLWDGTDCLCCDNPPWFYKQLPLPTNDNIEMRVCRDEGNENIAIKVVNIYIQ